MNAPWAIRIALEDAAALATLRSVPGVEVAQVDDVVWVRGPGLEQPWHASLAAVPAQARYLQLESGQLRHPEHRIPSAHLPDTSWQPLKDWLNLEWPLAALPATPPNPVPLRLVRSAEEQSAELLLTTWDAFQRFGRQAAQVRLDRLRFAADTQGRVLIRGTPLPPLPGTRFVLHHRVAVPAGYHWEPAVSGVVLARCLSATSHGIVVWMLDGTITRVQEEQFVPAARGALLATAQAMSHA